MVPFDGFALQTIGKTLFEIINMYIVNLYMHIIDVKSFHLSFKTSTDYLSPLIFRNIQQKPVKTHVSSSPSPVNISLSVHHFLTFGSADPEVRRNILKAILYSNYVSLRCREESAGSVECFVGGPRAAATPRRLVCLALQNPRY